MYREQEINFCYSNPLRLVQQPSLARAHIWQMLLIIPDPLACWVQGHRPFAVFFNSIQVSNTIASQRVQNLKLLGDACIFTSYHVRQDVKYLKVDRQCSCSLRLVIFTEIYIKNRKNNEMYDLILVIFTIFSSQRLI